MDNLVINTQGFTAVHTGINDNCGNAPTTPCEEAIQVSDSTGPHTVDTATSSTGKPVLTNLALSGDTLTWQHAGVPESAQLH